MSSDTPPIDRALVARRLKDEDWERTRVELLRFAISQCKSRELADDLVQDAIIRVMSADSTWNPATHPKLSRYLMGRIKFDLSTARRSAYARKTVALSRSSGSNEDGEDAPREGDDIAATNAFSEDVAERVDLFTRRMTKLREELAKNKAGLALELLDLTVEGVDTPAERAARTGKSFEAIEAARRQMQHHAARVAQMIGDDESPAARDDEAEGEIA
jgi:DNA-directed RNA polymerase specialized sigma24 family protein